ncbi:hypothetical protein AB0O31_11280 [Kitasatospora cineracea]|uniref:hypothetical protein n=1 Tax=Kitasatospora cineracea TaxID=88074 RepID=UPI00343DFE2B
MQDDLFAADELLAGYSTYTAPEELVAAGAAPQIIGTITMTETGLTILTPETSVTSIPCYLA